MSFPNLTMSWDWLGGLPVRREKREAHAIADRAPAPEVTPSPVNIRLASGSIVRIDFDRSTQRMSFGRIR
jgi:hypothetical protein